MECASIALALHLTRPLIWDRLDDAVRARTVAWMAGMIGAGTPRNNWIWFQNITEAFLRSVGGPWSRADLDRNLELTESWYAGDGWYADGEFGGGLRDFDYYNGWALLFYPLWYCLISGPDTEPGLRDRYAARLARYLSDAQHLVGADGAPLFHGRSLTYRFAMLAPFWTGALFDATPPAPGLTRRLGSGVLRHFVRAGAVDDRGLLSLGWHRSFPAIRQTYSGTGSPYWASKGFAGLLLPPATPCGPSRSSPSPSNARTCRGRWRCLAGWCRAPWPTAWSGWSTTAATTPAPGGPPSTNPATTATAPSPLPITARPTAPPRWTPTWPC